MVADVEELETMDASEIYAKRLDAKEVIFPKENGKFIFPVAYGRIKLPGGDQDLRTSTLVRERTIRGEDKTDFLWESEGSPLSSLQDSLADAGEARNDSWSISETSYTAITSNPESNFTRREKNHFLFHWNTLTSPELRRQTWMSCKGSRIDDYWNIDGSRDLSDSWTGVTQFTLKPPERYTWSGERLTKRQATSRPDHLCPDLWRGMSKNAKLREKHNWAIEKPKLDNARRLLGIYFIDPEDMEFKEIIKNVWRKLETPLAPAVLCKTCKKKQAWRKP